MSCSFCFCSYKFRRPRTPPRLSRLPSRPTHTAGRTLPGFRLHTTYAISRRTLDYLWPVTPLLPASHVPAAPRHQSPPHLHSEFPASINRFGSASASVLAVRGNPLNLNNIPMTRAVSFQRRLTRPEMHKTNSCSSLRPFLRRSTKLPNCGQHQ